jgi:ParB-like nuclease domain
MKYALHPACAMWPQMSEPELEALAADIRMNGLRQPIVLHESTILDGRNRALACERAGVELITEIYNGTDHLGFVVSANLHRRHLSTMKRAEIAAKMANMKMGANQYVKGGSAKLQTQISVTEAAKLMGVSPRSVQTARAKEKSSTKPPRMTPDELAAVGRSRKAERYYTEDGGSKSRIKLISDENRSLKAENAKLKEEVFRLNSDLAAIQTGQIMQMSRAALEQRRAIMAKQKTKREQRLAVETAPDEKTKEEFERQIQRLKTQVNTERAKAASIIMQRDALKAFSRDDRKFLLVFSHPDGATDPVEKAKRERAFKLINSIPEADA